MEKSSKKFKASLWVKLLIPTFVFALAILVNPLKTKALNYSYYTYTVTNNKATITDCDTSITGDITLPETLGGYTVTKIGDRAFEDCSKLTGVKFSSKIEEIGYRAFTKCSSLTEIVIPDNVTKIGEE